MGLEKMWGMEPAKKIAPERVREGRELYAKIVGLSDQEFKAVAKTAKLNEAEQKAMETFRRTMPELEASREKVDQSGVFGIITEAVEAVKNISPVNELAEVDLRAEASAIDKLRAVL